MTLDANILIAYLDSEHIVVETIHELFQSGATLFLPAVVHTELLSFGKLTNQQIKKIDTFLLENFAFIQADTRLSRLAAQIRREVRIKTPDAYVAATALAFNTPLLTRNVKDFKHIPDLIVQTI